MIRRKDFQTFIKQGEQAQGGVMGGLPKESGILCVFWGGKKCEKKINSYVWRSVVRGKKMCANKEHGKKLCVVNSCSGVHGRISMNKPLDSYLK